MDYISEKNMAHFSYLNDYSDMRDVIFRKRNRFKHMDAFTQNVLRGPSELSIQQRELIAAYVSALNACSFCSGIHTQVAINFGMSEDLIQKLIENEEEAPIEEKMRPILALVKKLTLLPNKMQKSDIEAIVNSGWSESAAEDTICIAALFNYYNRLMDGHGIKGYPGIFKEGAGMLSKYGYKFPGFIVLFMKWFGIKRPVQEV